MAQKRKAQEAFGGRKSQLSAFAAAKLGRQSASTPPPRTTVESEESHGEVTATEVAEEPYDGHHSGRTTPGRIGVGEQAEPAIPKYSPTPLSSFKPKNDNVIQDDEHCFEFVLQDNETATLIGEYEVSVSRGVITIYGAVLRPNSGPRRVFSPSVSALPQIQARKDSTTIHISSISSGLRKLEKVSPLFRNIWSSDPESKRSFNFLATSEDDVLQRSLNPLEIDNDMDMVLRMLSAKSVAEREQPRIMTIGGKSSGKSTFNRVLCNHLHSWTPGKKCLYLDLDPGQPEFGPSGQVSLVEVSAPVLGLPFTHPASSQFSNFRLIRSHTISATTFKDDPTFYKACARDLAGHADRVHPLIVNACGWTSGLGASVLRDLFTHLAITDAVLLEPLDTDLVESLQSVAHDSTFHRLARRAPRPSTRSPAEIRAMQTMAYFHSRASSVSDTIKFSGKALSHVRHWNVSYAESDVAIAAVFSYNQNPNPEFLAETLDGSLVAIVVLERYEQVLSTAEDDGTKMLRDVSEHISRTPEGIPFVQPNKMGLSRTLDPRHSYCVGLALVRGIDVAKKELHLVTPLSVEQIEGTSGRSVVLVRGGFDSPAWAYLEDVYQDGQHDGYIQDVIDRPWVSLRGQVGIEGSVWRLRHPPLANAQAMNSG